MKKRININELANIIALHFGYECAHIESIHTFTMDMRLGAGSVLGVELDLYNRKDKPKQS